jgi:hypothetical protein
VARPDGVPTRALAELQIFVADEKILICAGMSPQAPPYHAIPSSL